MLPATVENDFQLSVKIGAYYKFPKQIEAKVAVSYHRSLHFQMDTQLSACIIRRRLFDAGYRRYTDKRKPIRNASQRKVCLKFTNDYIAWLSHDWKRIIWTDEAHFHKGRRVRASSRRKTPEINGTWKHYSCQKSFELFPANSCYFRQELVGSHLVNVQKISGRNTASTFR